jgi:hypothetical protein
MSAGDKERKYMMRFDVEEMVSDWLVSGQKRGDFAAMVWFVSISLIAKFLSVLKGWRYLYGPHLSYCFAPWRDGASEGCRNSTSSDWRVYYGIHGYS